MIINILTYASNDERLSSSKNVIIRSHTRVKVLHSRARAIIMVHCETPLYAHMRGEDMGHNEIKINKKEDEKLKYYN